MIFKLLLLNIFLFSLTAQSKFKEQGEVTFESQFFENDQDDLSYDQNYSVKTSFQAQYQKKSFQAKFKGFIRADSQDEARQVSVPEEIWLGYQKDSLVFRAGYQIINWTATEAFHPADAINSRNLDSDAQNAEKFGELIISTKWIYGAGSFSYLYMPSFKAARFPPPSSNLGFGIGNIKLDTPKWIDNNNNIIDHHGVSQMALLWSHNFDNSDVTLHLIDHVNRNQPAFVATGSSLTPVYKKVLQYGGTFQYVLNSWLIKLEGAHLDFHDAKFSGALFDLQPKDHTELAIGLENSRSLANGSELTLIAEYQRFLNTDPDYDDSYLFQNDLLFGARYALNNQNGSEYFFSVITDLAGRDEFFYNLDYSQRLTNFWKISTGFRVIDATLNKTKTANGLENIRDTDRLYFNLTRYF